MPQAMGTQPDEPSGQVRHQTVLVVDDEVDIRDSLKELFDGSLKDVEVLTAESGTEALKILKAQPIDLILTDYKMPGMNGLEFLAEARRAAASVPRILMTAFPDLELAIRAVNEERIENFLTKPLEPESVVQVVQDILGDQRANEFRNRAFARSLDLLRRQLKEDR